MEGVEAVTVFLVLGGIGLAVVLFSLLVGDVLEGVFEVDFLDNDLFSAASLGAFVGALGFGGAITLSLVDVTWVAIVAGVMFGCLAAWGAASLTRWLKGREVAAHSTSSLVGVAGRVITPIAHGSYGEVRLTSGGYHHKVAARAELDIPAGTEVWVSQVLSPTAVQVELTHEPDTTL